MRMEAKYSPETWMTFSAVYSIVWQRTQTYTCCETGQISPGEANCLEPRKVAHTDEWRIERNPAEIRCQYLWDTNHVSVHRLEVPEQELV
jgi:hypothetical protein